MTKSVYDQNCLSCNSVNLEYFGNYYINCFQTNANGCEPMVNLIHCRDCHFVSVVMITKGEVDNHRKIGKNPQNETIQNISNNKPDSKPISSYSLSLIADLMKVDE